MQINGNIEMESFFPSMIRKSLFEISRPLIQNSFVLSGKEHRAQTSGTLHVPKHAF
jgi:hypothetical protein